MRTSSSLQRANKPFSFFLSFFIRVPCAPRTKKQIEYCTVHGHPRPQFFDALDDSGGAAAVRHKVWVVLGSERLELPTAYPGVHEGEEKMARKVLRHLRSRNTGEAQQE